MFGMIERYRSQWTFAVLAATVSVVAFSCWRVESAMQDRDAAERRAASFLADIENLDGARVVLDDKGTVREWNRGAEHLLGWSFEEIEGYGLAFMLPTSEMKIAHRDAYRRTFSSLASAAEVGHTRTRKCWAKHRDGHLVNVEVRSRIERRGDEYVSVALLWAVDEITEAADIPKPE